MKLFFFTAIIFVSSCFLSFPQEQYTIMSYNLLNYPGSTSAIRNPYFRTIIENTLPDILVVQEMLSQTGVDGFLNNVLNSASSGYAAGEFIDGPDTDNAIFFKSSSFTLLANNVIPTTLRDINEFVLKESITNDTIRIYSVHLKAGTASSDESQRLAEVTALRNVTDNLPSNSNYIVLGDFNIYGSNEAAYIKLLDQTTPGYVVDIYNLTGTWNNQQYAEYHTQSPRTRQFGGGSSGGMDDRFDMILFSEAVMDSGDIYYLPDSFTNFGNDGTHYNDSINRPPNNAVGQIIANALHSSSDHIPIFATIRFESTNITQISVNLIDGWNMLSVPLSADDMTGTELFPTVISSFYGYDGSYVQTDILENGKGYWAKFNGSQNNIINGTYLSSDEIAVNQGWNLIGPFSSDVDVNDITTSPPNILASSFFGYEVGYISATTLVPGKGYWIKTNSPGTIQLNTLK